MICFFLINSTREKTYSLFRAMLHTAGLPYACLLSPSLELALCALSLSSRSGLTEARCRARPPAAAFGSARERPGLGRAAQPREQAGFRACGRPARGRLGRASAARRSRALPGTAAARERAGAAPGHAPLPGGLGISGSARTRLLS